MMTSSRESFGLLQDDYFTAIIIICITGALRSPRQDWGPVQTQRVRSYIVKVKYYSLGN